MAIQSINFVKGRLHNVVFFERAGTYMARSLPDKVHMSAASKQCSGNFGKASACGKTLRLLLGPVLPHAKDRRMQIRFSGAIARWLGAAPAAGMPPTPTIAAIIGFGFNPACSIAQRWKLPLTVLPPAGGVIAVQVPAFVPTQVISPPAGCVSVECRFTAAGCLLANAAATGSHTATLHIPYTAVPMPAKVVTLPLPAPAGTLVITAVALRYLLADGSVCEEDAFLPAGVVGACYC